MSSDKKYPPQYYRDYLQLDKVLEAQHPVSKNYGEEAHDELLFIITHQAYELWFKQVLHELEAIRGLFGKNPIPEQDIALAYHYLQRVNKILRLLTQQFEILETMTPLDFVDFREYLNPASGFQSLQFRILEITMGLLEVERLNFGGQTFASRLNDHDRKLAEAAAAKPSLFLLVEQWLERMPFMEDEGYKFWDEYARAVRAMMEDDKDRLRSSGLEPEGIQQQLQQIDNALDSFDALFDEQHYETLRSEGKRRLSMKATHAALFIFIYRDTPLLQLPFRLLNELIETDKSLAMWRYRHAMMVSGMIGSKIGTGGSSGHSYLLQTAVKHRVFDDIAGMSSYFIPRRNVPPLPDSIRRKLNFVFGGNEG